MKKVLTISLLLVLTIGCKCKKTAADSMKGNNVTIIKENGYGGRDTESHQLVNSQSEFEALCSELNIENAPVIDFSKNSVVAVFLGQKSTGGYNITIEKVEMDKSTAKVLIRNTKPEKGAMVTMALTAPYCVASIPKSNKVEIQKM